MKIESPNAQNSTRRHAHNRLEFDPKPIVEAYLGGESELAISKRVGLKRVVIRSRLVEAGVAIRGRSEAMFLRMSKTTFKQRQELTAKSHVGRGLMSSDSKRLMLERTAAARCKRRGFNEAPFADALNLRGLPVDEQTPCGPYNIDITVGTVAVELFTLPHERFAKARFPERFKFLADRGYTLLAFCFHHRDPQSFLTQLDEMVRIVDETYRLPSPSRKHRMIRCGVNRFTRFQNDLGQFAVKSASETFFYTATELHP